MKKFQQVILIKPATGSLKKCLELSNLPSNLVKYTQAPIAQWIEYEFAELGMTVRFCLGAPGWVRISIACAPHLADSVGSHSGQLHRFRKPKGVIPTQVQILHPPPCDIIHP